MCSFRSLACSHEESEPRSVGNRNARATCTYPHLHSSIILHYFETLAIHGRPIVSGWLDRRRVLYSIRSIAGWLSGCGATYPTVRLSDSHTVVWKREEAAAFNLKTHCSELPAAGENWPRVKIGPRTGKEKIRSSGQWSVRWKPKSVQC